LYSPAFSNACALAAFIISFLSVSNIFFFLPAKKSSMCLIEELLKEGHSVMAFEFEEPWLDIGSFQTYIAAHKLVVGEKVVQGEGSTCVNTKCEGSVVLGPKCSVKNAELKDCIVFAGARIENCTLMRCIVDDGCVLSGLDLRDKMLRAGTRLELQ
jgi:NDP-sugar pyrophosphorylase family protein